MNTDNTDTADGDKCERCGGEIDPRAHSDRYCGECQAYAAAQMEIVEMELSKPNVDKVVDVYCECQSQDDFGLIGLESGESDVKCPRCGSKEIVYKEVADR
jgi:DNA-directed RNA polymerase subunit M/transcription elongation factor TFIIS